MLNYTTHENILIQQFSPHSNPSEKYNYAHEIMNR